jgi:hypothetical protein
MHRMYRITAPLAWVGFILSILLIHVKPTRVTGWNAQGKEQHSLSGLSLDFSCTAAIGKIPV